MKTGIYLCCVGIAFVMFVEVSSQEQGILNDPVDKRGLYLESAQSQNAAATAGKQSSSFLNVDGGYPAQSQYSAPGGWSGADGNSLQLGQQSSESASAHSSLNQYSKLIADGAYGGQPINQYPQYLPSGLQGQLSQSAAGASASAQSSGSQYQSGSENPYYPSGSNSQYLQQSAQAEASASSQGGVSNVFEQPQQPQQVNYQPQPQSQPQSQFIQYPQEYYGGHGASASASAGSSAGSIGGGPSGISESGASAGASSHSFQQQENPLVPRLKCGYVRQCKTVYEPSY